jgi:hypothetical protein
MNPRQTATIDRSSGHHMAHAQRPPYRPGPMEATHALSGPTTLPIKFDAGH